VSAESGRSAQIISGRDVKVSVKALLNQYDAGKYDKFINGTSTQFLYNFGVKSGGNWVAGKCGCVFIPTAVINSFKVSNDNGICVLEMELTAYVDSSGNGEVYLNFL
jgi:hypothetical protein